MRRAVRLSSLLLPLTLALVLPAHARETTVDGAGMVDYTQPPNFEVGSWVKYRMQSSSLQGFKDDYSLTILIAGEEDWWGERCFWVETWTEDAGKSKRTMASLLPYAMFGDSNATKHVTWFLRKSIQGINQDGTIQQVLHRRDDADLLARRGAPKQDPVETMRDTLGRDSTTVPQGHFADCLKTRQVVKMVEQVTRGDSSIYYERNEERVVYRTRQVPITNFARENVDDHQEGRSWRLGESAKAGPLKTLERARGALVLVGKGKGDLTPELVPAHLRKSIKEQEAAQKAAPKPAAKKTSRPG